MGITSEEDIPNTEQELYEFFARYLPEIHNNAPRGLKRVSSNQMEIELKRYLMTCTREELKKWDAKRERFEKRILAQRLAKLHSKGVNRFRLDNR